MPSHPIARFLAPAALAVAACALLPLSNPGPVSAAPPVIEPGSLTTWGQPDVEPDWPPADDDVEIGLLDTVYDRPMAKGSRNER